MAPEAKLKAQTITESLEELTKGDSLAAQHMQELMKFQEKQNISVIWSNGREQVYTKVGGKNGMDHLKTSQLLASSLEQSAKRGGKAAGFAEDIAKDIRKGSSNSFLNRLGVANKGAAGHTADGFGAIVIRRQSHQVAITAKNVERYRAAVRLGTTDAGYKAPKFVTDQALYQKTSKGDWISKEGWMTTYTHEMGHQVHFIAGQPSLPSGVKWTPSKYGATNAQEQFAETFVQYVHSPEELKKASPEAYEWISEAVKEVLK